MEAATGLLPSRAAIAAACRKHHVRYLDLFGSMSDGTARPDSDVDLLCALDVPPGTPILDTFLALRSELEDVFGRPVDLVQDATFRNPYFRAAVERQRRRLFP